MDTRPINNTHNLQHDTASRPGEPSASSANTAPQPLESTLNPELAPANHNDINGDVQMNDWPRLASAAAAALVQSRWATEDEHPENNQHRFVSRANRRPRDGGSGNNAPAARNRARARSRSPRRHGEDQIIRLRDNPRPANAAARTTSVNWNLEPEGYLTHNSRGTMAIKDENMDAVQNSAISLNTNTIRASTTGSERFINITDRMSTIAPLLVRPEDTVRLVFQIDRRRQHIRSANPSRSQEANMRHNISRQGAAPRRVQPDFQPQVQRAPREHNARPQQPPAEPEELPAEVQHPPPQLQPRVLVCANCGIEGHALRDCVTHWTPAGDIPGCYRCNDISHTIDSCPVQPPYDDAMKYQIEVIDRSGRPPLRSARGWNQVAVAMNYRGPGPISKEYMKGLYLTHFNTWDYGLSSMQQWDLLIKDPATVSLEQIKNLPNQGYDDLPRDKRGALRQLTLDARLILERLERGQLHEQIGDEEFNAHTSTLERLVVFKNIKELRERNEQLLKVTHKLMEVTGYNQAEAVAARSQAIEDHKERGRLKPELEIFKDTLRGFQANCTTSNKNWRSSKAL
ncbi:hypothetical protein F4815DRAFT_450610 [Daldinia loculata]|nr:hypothetical protein F4815DRAFT_450610 [Daldinia loculata]